MDQTTLRELKMDLYRSLLLVAHYKLTKTEMEIAYWLARDKDIQAILNETAWETS